VWHKVGLETTSAVSEDLIFQFLHCCSAILQDLLPTETKKEREGHYQKYYLQSQTFREHKNGTIANRNGYGLD
jgi:hypothetical protein